MSWYLEILTAVSFLTNLGAFVYVRRMFDTNQAIYYIIALDATYAFVNNLDVLMVSLMRSLLENYLWVPCSILILSHLTTFFTAPILNCLVAWIRLNKTERNLWVCWSHSNHKHEDCIGTFHPWWIFSIFRWDLWTCWKSQKSGVCKLLATFNC